MAAEVKDQLSLDYIGIMEGTDKCSVAVDYLRHYERILGGMRNDPIRLLEIGVADGASLRTWVRFFRCASIIGVDNNDDCRRHAGSRVTVEIGSQADPEFLTMLAARYQPSVIIDDGSHQTAHVFLTFEYLFPSLLPGGVYIIEDVYLHHGDTARYLHAQGGITPVEYFSAIAARLTSDHLGPDCDEPTRRLVEMIERIEFIPKAIVIHKRSDDDTRKRLDDLFDAAQKADQPIIWFHLSWHLLRDNDLERAEFAARRCVALVPNGTAYWPRLAHILTRQGKITEAIDALHEAIRLNPDNPTLNSDLATLEARPGVHRQ